MVEVVGLTVKASTSQRQVSKSLRTANPESPCERERERERSRSSRMTGYRGGMLGARVTGDSRYRPTVGESESDKKKRDEEWQRGLAQVMGREHSNTRSHQHCFRAMGTRCTWELVSGQWTITRRHMGCFTPSTPEGWTGTRPTRGTMRHWAKNGSGRRCSQHPAHDGQPSQSYGHGDKDREFGSHTINIETTIWRAVGTATSAILDTAGRGTMPSASTMAGKLARRLPSTTPQQDWWQSRQGQWEWWWGRDDTSTTYYICSTWPTRVTCKPYTWGPRKRDREISPAKSLAKPLVVRRGAEAGPGHSAEVR